MAGRIALVIGSVLFSLIVLELGCRIARGPEWLVQWPNIVLSYGPLMSRNDDPVRSAARC